MEDITAYDQVLSPRTWEDQCDDSQLEFVNEIAANFTFDAADLDADDLGTFEIDENMDMVEFLEELDPLEAAEVQAIVSEFTEAYGDPASAQQDVMATFETFAPKNRKRRASSLGGGSIAHFPAPPVVAVAQEQRASGSDSDSAPAAKWARAARVPAAIVTAVPMPRMSASGGGAAKAPAAKASAPQRCVPWRKRGSDENVRMRAAVWVYRFAPRVKSKTVQKRFGVAVKSLMRYVYASCEPEFAAYDLYFGPAGQGPAGKADRALSRKEGRVPPGAIGYVVDPSPSTVPPLAREFLLEAVQKKK